VANVESIRIDASGRELEALELPKASEEIWLHPEAGPDGLVVLKDQHGRQLRGVKAINFSSGMEQANELTVTVLAGVTGPMTNRKQPQ